MSTATAVMDARYATGSMEVADLRPVPNWGWFWLSIAMGSWNSLKVLVQIIPPASHLFIASIALLKCSAAFLVASPWLDGSSAFILQAPKHERVSPNSV